jgi:hypothetical protein
MNSVVYAPMYPYMDMQYLDTVIVDTIYNGCVAFNCSSSFFCDDVDVEVWDCPNLFAFPNCSMFEVQGGLPVGTLSAGNSVFNPLSPGSYSEFFMSNGAYNIVFTHATGAQVSCLAESFTFDQFPFFSSNDESCDSINGGIYSGYGSEFQDASFNGVVNNISIPYYYVLTDSTGNVISFGDTDIPSQIDSLEAGVYTMEYSSQCTGSSWVIPITVNQDTTGCTTQSCYSGYVVCKEGQDPVENAPVNLSVDGGVTVYSDSQGFFSYCKSTNVGSDSVTTVVVDESWFTSSGYFDDGASIDIVFKEESQSISDASNNTLQLNCSSQGLGIESLAGIQIHLFPNPTSNVLNIVTSDLVNQIQVVDMNGRVVMTNTHTNLNTTLDISELDAGYYSIRFIGEAGTAHRQFVKM